MQKNILRLSLVSGVVLLLMGLYLGLDLAYERRATASDAKEAARQQTVDTANDLDEELERYAKMADELASGLDLERFVVHELAPQLERELDANSNLHSIGIACAPFACGKERRLFAPSLERREGKLELLQLEDAFDYTSPDHAWFTEAMAGEAGWREPVWDASLQALRATYSTPFPSAGDGNGASGVVWLSFSLESVGQRLQALDLGPTGYAGIVSKEGYPLAYPSAAMVRDHVSFFDLPEVRSDPSFRAVVESATRGERGSMERNSRLTGQASWVLWEPVVESGWSTFVVLIKDEIPVDHKALRRRVIWIIVSAVFGLIGVGGWACIRARQRHPTNAMLWGLVAMSTILMVMGVLSIRHVVLRQPVKDDVDRVAVVDRSGLDAFLTTQSAGRAGESSPHRIPIGIYLQSMKFVAPQELFVTGYVWQKNGTDAPTDRDPAFVMPDAINPRITEAYRFGDDGVETMGWYVETTIRQNLNLSSYPFDDDEVSIRFEPRGLDQRLVLVPDLDSYTSTHPGARPGLDRKLRVAGWNVVGSLFDYKFENYDSSLGIPGRSSDTIVPELNFNVRIQRSFLDVVIGNGIPLIIVLVMSFAMLASSSRDEEESKLFGFNPSDVMKIGSFLFFIVLLAHVQLRNTTQVQQVVFMEYIYFVVYSAILLVSLHNFLFSLERYNKGRLGYCNGLVQKLLFWPLVSCAVLLVTLVQFY